MPRPTLALHDPTDVPAAALARLLAGNVRFAAGRAVSPRRTPAAVRRLADGQEPFAVVISCADSRVSPEILFDVGKGDLFVIRVAGNVIDGAGAVIKGSIEYAVAELHVPLVLVLGHTGCGAVKAAMQHLQAHDPLPGAIADLVDLIKPAVTFDKHNPDAAGDPLTQAIRRNVLLGVQRLSHLDPILAPAVESHQLQITGALYDLHTGRVAIL